MHLARKYLLARCITDETVRVHGLELDNRLSATIIKSRLGRKLLRSVNELIWFPLPDAQGTVCSYIARILPDVNFNGRKFRFLCPRGSDGPPYIPKSVFGLKSGSPLVITEGPVKSSGLRPSRVGRDRRKWRFRCGLAYATGQISAPVRSRRCPRLAGPEGLSRLRC